MATVYFTASSLDGYIVDDAESLDWLTSRAIDANGPFGYQAFVKSVGALVMGAATYEWVATNHPGDWMYDQPSWVLTHRPHIIADGHPVAKIAGVVAAGLIDEMIVTYAPCSLGGGSRLLPIRSEWALVDSGVNGDFVCAHWRKA